MTRAGGHDVPLDPDSSLTRIDVDRRDDAVLIAVHGNVDYASAPDLSAAIRDVLDDLGDRPLVLDLTEVGFFGSAGIAILVEGAELAAQRRPGTFRPFRVVVDETRPVIRPIEISGMDRCLRLYQDAEEARTDGSDA